MKTTKRKFLDSLRGIGAFVAPYKRAFLFAILMIVVSTAGMVIAPSIEGNITSVLYADVKRASDLQHVAISFERIFSIMVTLVGVYLVKTIGQALSVIYLTNAIQNAMQDLRDALQNKIRKLPVRYFDSHHYGDILSRITNDVDAISNAFQQSFSQIISGVLTILLALVMMFRLNVVMACTAVLIIPGMLLITITIVRHSQKRFAAQQNALGNLNGAITEMYTGYNEILLYNRQEASIDEFKRLNEELRNNACKA